MIISVDTIRTELTNRYSHFVRGLNSNSSNMFDKRRGLETYSTSELESVVQNAEAVKNVYIVPNITLKDAEYNIKRIAEQLRIDIVVKGAEDSRFQNSPAYFDLENKAVVFDKKWMSLNDPLKDFKVLYVLAYFCFIFMLFRVLIREEKKELLDKIPDGMLDLDGKEVGANPYEESAASLATQMLFLKSDFEKYGEVRDGLIKLSVVKLSRDWQ